MMKGITQQQAEPIIGALKHAKLASLTSMTTQRTADFRIGLSKAIEIVQDAIEEVKEPKWIKFILYPHKTRKTLTYLIRNKESDVALGWIKWHTGFRKYSFYPDPDMVFESTCLQDIINFMDGLMEERKKEKIIHITYDPDKKLKSVGGRIDLPDLGELGTRSL